MPPVAGAFGCALNESRIWFPSSNSGTRTTHDRRFRIIAIGATRFATVRYGRMTPGAPRNVPKLELGNESERELGSESKKPGRLLSAAQKP